MPFGTSFEYMLKNFYPDHYVGSAYVIDYEKLYAEGKRAIIFDIDNTLVEHGAPSDERSRALFWRLRNTGFKTLVLSNNREPRVKSFAEEVGTEYIYKAGKPFSKGYKRALEHLGETKETTIFVGDQIFTDVYGAKRLGIETFLTMPIDPKEEIQIVLKRFLEKPVIWSYLRDRTRNKP